MAINASKYNTLTIRGKTFSKNSLLTLCREKVCQKEIDSRDRAFYQFILEWLDEHEYIEVKTSGSTGRPKTIQVSKAAMLQSAFNTLKFFNLKPGHSALLCLPCDFIAGKMMVIRAFAGKLNLIPVPATGQPLKELNQSVDFAAMTPMQMHNEIISGVNKLNYLRTVILGGSPVSRELDQKLQDVPAEVWETYGMTETLSHIALRRINGSSAESYFTPLENVEVQTSANGCLSVYAPGITKSAIETNDLVDFGPGNKFRIKGRLDNIINSGGIKISPEEVEARISELFPHPFFISSQPHPSLGQEPVLITEQIPENEKALLQTIKKHLPPHHAPRKIIIMNPLPRTDTGKIKRKF